MTPTSDTPDNPRDFDQSLTPRDEPAAANEAPATASPAGTPQDQDAADALPVDEPSPTESDLDDLPDEGLTAEERLLDSIVSDPRAVAGMDEPDEEPALPADPGEPREGESVRGGAAINDDVLESIRRLENEVQNGRDELARMTADRDDLAGRLDLAAVEFDRLNQEIDAREVELGKLHASLETAQGSVKEAQDALTAAEARTAKALQDCDAAGGRIEEVTAASQREQDLLRTMLRQIEADDEQSAHRRWRLISAGAVVIALLALAGGYVLGRASSRSSIVAKPMSPALPLLPPPAALAPARAVPTNEVRTASAAVVPPGWPLIRDPRITVREEPGALVIRFNNPVFARGAEILPASRQDLRRVAAMLRPNTPLYRVEVEGHTDASPVASGASYASNHELGLVRARAVTEVLAKEGGLPLSSLSISSAGDTNPPFPGDSAEARRRCRTVVIKLHRATPGAR